MKKFLILLALAATACGVELGTTDCERLHGAVEAAAARCHIGLKGHRSCDDVIASSISDVDACVAWHETVTCEGMLADTYWIKKCAPSLLVSPL